MGKKKILIITYCYPPLNSIASLRPASFAKYLPESGWEPIIVTRDWSREEIRAKEPEGVSVIRTGYRDRLSFYRGVDEGLRNNDPQRDWWTRSKFRQKLSFYIRELLTYPDVHIGWRPYALEAVRELLKKEKVDVIFSTSPPPTSHLIASEVQKETGIPWVADYRDLWTHNHYARHTFFRERSEEKLEKQIIGNAKRLITVSAPLAEKLRNLHQKPVNIVKNGFESENYSNVVGSTPCFSITYTGRIYEGIRDPFMLFSAVSELIIKGNIQPDSFKVRFFGPGKDAAKLLALAKKCGVEDVVGHQGFISHEEAITRQQESTVLLLLNWGVPEEKGVYTGKIFEYLGAKRPVLALPRVPGGVVDDLLTETGSGIVAGTKEELCGILKSWYDEFLNTGQVAYSGNSEAVEKYTRRAQAKKLAEVLDEVVF